MNHIDRGSIKAFERYQNMLLDKKIKPVNHTEILDGDPTSLEHILWMCKECLQKMPNGISVDKYSRWLGYVQGVLICRQLTTVEEERNTTRPWLK